MTVRMFLMQPLPDLANGGVDEALDTLGPMHREIIVVGIDNGADKRLNEYSPFDMERYGRGEGDQ